MANKLQIPVNSGGGSILIPTTTVAIPHLRKVKLVTPEQVQTAPGQIIALTVQEYVTTLYLNTMLRIPTGAEMSSAVAALSAGCAAGTLLNATKTLIDSLFTSSFYVSRGESNSQYVQDLYLSILGRASPPLAPAPSPTPIAGDTSLINNISLPGQSATSGNWKWYYITLPTGASQLQVTATGSGDGILHTRFGAKPDLSTYNCRAYTVSPQICTHANPASGTWWIGAYANSGTINFSMLAVVSGLSDGSYWVDNLNAATLTAQQVRDAFNYGTEHSNRVAAFCTHSAPVTGQIWPRGK